MDSCLFCEIANGKIPAKIVYRDDLVMAFEDINPQAPTHILIIPLKHIATLNELEAEHNELIGYLIWTANKLAKKMGVDKDGYRMVLNCNKKQAKLYFIFTPIFWVADK